MSRRGTMWILDQSSLTSTQRAIDKEIRDIVIGLRHKLKTSRMRNFGKNLMYKNRCVYVCFLLEFSKCGWTDFDESNQIQNLYLI